MAWRMPGVSELGRLGSGSTGRVVSAQHKASGSYVAVKYLADRLRLDNAFLAEYREIVTVLAGLDDPHLTRVYEYVENPQGAALVMEHVDGVTLGELIAAGRLEPIAALRMYRAVLRGLGTLHDQGLTHDDVKPGNILLDGSGTIKLTDVGLCAPAAAGSMVPGTPAYLAPERWAGQTAHPTSDIYAATAVLVHALTGRAPFGAGSRDAHRTQAIPEAGIPQALRPLVASGMAKNADDRPYDAKALAADVTVLAVELFGLDWDDYAQSALTRRIAPVLASVQNTSADSRVGDAMAGLADRPLATKVLATGLGAGIGVMLFSAFSGPAPAAIAGLAEPSFTLDLPSTAPAPAPTPTGTPKPGPHPTPTATPSTPSPQLIPLSPNPTPLPTGPAPGPHPTTPHTTPPTHGGGGGGGGGQPTPTPTITPTGGGGGGGGSTPTPTPTPTATDTPTPDPTPTPTDTPTPDPTPTPTDTPTQDPTPTDQPSPPPTDTP